ncbi:hypothetical protein LY78DRAFT_139381 [Colletotrichum sublineola]|nr:hypothetical protein LY78DRAFT_139381 [Colletotrichum sublineola]
MSFSPLFGLQSLFYPNLAASRDWKSRATSRTSSESSDPFDLLFSHLVHPLWRAHARDESFAQKFPLSTSFTSGRE